MTVIQLSRQVELAIAILVIASRSGEDWLRTEYLADQTNISGAQAAKIINFLGRGGLLETKRGKHGGLRIGRPADTIRLSDVIVALGPLVNNRTAHRSPTPVSALLSGISREATNRVADIFAAFSIEDVASGRIDFSAQGTPPLADHCGRSGCPLHKGTDEALNARHH